MYQQITLAQFRALLRERLGATLAPFYRDVELNGIVQEALRVFNSLTGFWRTRQVLTTAVDQHWYVIQGSITSAMRVMYNGRPITFAPLNDLDSGQQYWESETTVTGGTAPAAPELWTIGGLNLIGIWPADHVAGNALLVDGIAATPVLTGDGQYVDIGKEELNCLLDYCEHIALFKEGGAEFSATLPSDDNTQALFGSFLKGAASRNGMLARSEAYRKWLGGDSANQGKNPLRRDAKVGAR
jgi:hypothetical protein